MYKEELELDEFVMNLNPGPGSEGEDGEDDLNGGGPGSHGEDGEDD